MKLNLKEIVELIIEDKTAEITEAIIDRANDLFDPNQIAENLLADYEIIDAMTEAVREVIEIVFVCQ